MFLSSRLPSVEPLTSFEGMLQFGPDMATVTGDLKFLLIAFQAQETLQRTGVT